MITLKGSYTSDKEDRQYEFVCRVFQRVNRGASSTFWYNGVAEVVEIHDTDILMQLGNGTWHALYREVLSDEQKAKLMKEALAP